jgi:hypothetical protein
MFTDYQYGMHAITNQATTNQIKSSKRKKKLVQIKQTCYATCYSLTHVRSFSRTSSTIRTSITVSRIALWIYTGNPGLISTGSVSMIRPNLNLFPAMFRRTLCSAFPQFDAAALPLRCHWTGQVGQFEGWTRGKTAKETGKEKHFKVSTFHFSSFFFLWNTFRLFQSTPF